MQILLTVLYIVMAISAVGLIVVVVLQPGQASGMGALVGETEASFGKEQHQIVRAEARQVDKNIRGGVVRTEFYNRIARKILLIIPALK